MTEKFCIIEDLRVIDRAVKTSFESPRVSASSALFEIDEYNSAVPPLRELLDLKTKKVKVEEIKGICKLESAVTEI